MCVCVCVCACACMHVRACMHVCVCVCVLEVTRKTKFEKKGCLLHSQSEQRRGHSLCTRNWQTQSCHTLALIPLGATCKTSLTKIPTIWLNGHLCSHTHTLSLSLSRSSCFPLLFFAFFYHFHCGRCLVYYYYYYYWCSICLYPSVIIFHCECLGY